MRRRQFKIQVQSVGQRWVRLVKVSATFLLPIRAMLSKDLRYSYEARPALMWPRTNWMGIRKIRGPAMALHT